MQLPNFKSQKGYLTFACNTADTDYLRLAYLQALSIKVTQKINEYCVVVDKATAALITDKQRQVFDYVRIMEFVEDGPFMNEWQAQIQSPFKETVKLDSDIIFTRNIDHWWNIMQAKDVCCTVSVKDYEGNTTTARTYRRLFDENNLPNVYSGFTYFRYTELSTKFFQLVADIFHNWPIFRDELLKNCRHDEPQTDEVYAIAVKLMGEENFYLPIDIPTFTHMKPAIQGWQKSINWMDKIYIQHDEIQLTVGFNRQVYPFHYVQKHFATEEMISHYERIIKSD